MATYYADRAVAEYVEQLEVENKRLRKLVEKAHCEGYGNGYDDTKEFAWDVPLTSETWLKRWEKSESKKTLEQGSSVIDE